MLGPVEFLAEDRGINVEWHDLEARASTSPPQLKGAPDASARGGRMKGTIIIAEDGRTQATALEAALQQAGATVTPKTAGAGAVRILAFDWAGSDDDLTSTIERAAAESSRGEPGSIPSLDEIERRHITRVLTAAHGNKTLAARILGVDRKTLHRKLSQYARSGSGQSENDVSAHH
jgi:DNA-binding NtrC family response regulator